MLFIVQFIDKPECLETRKQWLSAHLQWLEQHRQAVLVAGSLREEADAAPVGGLWVVEASSKPEVETLFHSDPFWVHGLRRSVEVLHWSKAFPERQVPV